LLCRVVLADHLLCVHAPAALTLAAGEGAAVAFAAPTMPVGRTGGGQAERGF